MTFFQRKQINPRTDWIAFEPSGEEMCCVSVVNALEAGAKPQVTSWTTIQDYAMNEADELMSLTRKLPAKFQRALLLDRAEYKIMVVPEPPVPSDEIDQSLRWTLGTLLDFPISDASYDWIPIPTRKELPNRPPHLYVIAARKTDVLGHADAFVKAKLPLHAVDIRETAQRNIAALVETPGEGLALVSVVDQGILLTLTWNGELYLDRFIQEPLLRMLNGDADGIEESMDRIATEVQRSIQHLGRMLPFIHIGRLVVAPLPAPLPLQQHLQELLSIPVDKLDLSRVFDFSQAPELLDEHNQSRAFGVLGAALRGMAVSA